IIKIEGKVLTFALNSFVADEPDANDTSHVVKGQMKIDPLQHLPLLTAEKGGLEVFQPGQFIRINREGEVKFCQIASQEDVQKETEKGLEAVTRTTLRFKEKTKLPAGGELTLDNAVLVIDGNPFTGMHPLLVSFIEDLGRIQDLGFADL